jgi:isochorismate pyruvate lyase
MKYRPPRVTVIAVPADLPIDDLRTPELFADCVGRSFEVIGRHGDLLELAVGEVRGVAPKLHSIWIEPRYIAWVKSPQECSDMTDIRHEIDRLDRLVITLLGERFEYVKAAAPFKANATEVSAPDRFTAMLAQRRTWAVEEGLNADAIEKLYRDLVTHFIEEELRVFRSQHDD